MTPKIEMVYVFPLNSGYDDFAQRFVASYLEHPPGLQHKTTVVCNESPADIETTGLFSLLPNLNLIHHPGKGRDIGAYQFASAASDADLIIFFNSSVYFKRPGWMIRMTTAFQSHGEALYGSMGNRGNIGIGVWPHIRTTGFWCSPGLFNRYPSKITANEQRHPFEHGQNCLTEWVKRQGLGQLVVTWSGVYQWEDWDSPEGFHSGSQRDLLCGDRIAEPPYYHTA